MIGTRAWFALMRRNLLYRRRYWLSTLLEVFLPMAFVGILISIKNASNLNDRIRPMWPAKVTSAADTLIPMTFTDYVTALRAKRVCTTLKDEDFEITGIDDNGFSWQVPFVKCNSLNCQFLGQDATSFCEYHILAVAPKSRTDESAKDRAQSFIKWVLNKYPVLRNKPIPNPAMEQAKSAAKEGVFANGTLPDNFTEIRPLPFDHDFIQLFRDSADIDRYVRQPDYGRPGTPKIAMALVWEGGNADQYFYSLRPNSTNVNANERETRTAVSVQTTPPTTRLFNSYAKYDRETCPLEGTDTPGLGRYGGSCTGHYLYNGVITFQRLIGDFVHDLSGARDAGMFVAEAGLKVVHMPTAPFARQGFFGEVEDVAPILLVLGLLFPLSCMVGYVTKEKELRQKELMKMMSVNESDIGHSWFATFLMLNIIGATLTSIVSSSLWPASSAFSLWIFWQLMYLATTTFAMVFASLTSKTTRSVLIGVLVYIMGVFLTLAVDYRSASSFLVGLVSFHPVAAFSYGTKELGRLEDQGIGITSDTIFDSESVNGYSFMSTLRYLGIDALILGFLAWYLNRVITPDYGQALPWYFFLLPSYWFQDLCTCGKNNSPTTLPDDDDDDLSESSARFSRMFPSRGSFHSDNGREVNKNGVPVEPVTPQLRKQSEQGKSIEIRRLRKLYGDKAAVDGLNLSMYSGQITALLGHNGAGKTTTINMLTGATAPTSGKASVVGKDIYTQMHSIRQDIGICLQHDCLFPNLTVREHIQFFARLKGLYKSKTKKEAELEIDQSIRDVALYEKRNTLSKNLSGGMKRKLSVAIAFCGGSKVVLLDEPTSGMDPFSRRFTWNVIRQYRQDRCIILTTHFMDEADILGDRIAIMAQGQLRCCGSSLFLKRHYGVGYHLTIQVNEEYFAKKEEYLAKKEAAVRESSGVAAHADDSENSFAADTVDADADAGDDKVLSASTNRKNELSVSFHVPSDNIKSIIERNVEEAVQMSDVGSEIIYQLPVGATSKFTKMFEELDKLVAMCAVNSYGVSITTLDEVFVMVTRGDTCDKEKLESASQFFDSSSHSRSSLTLKAASASSPDTDIARLVENAVTMNETDDSECLEEPKPDLSFKLEPQHTLFFRHLKALIYKRAIYFKRDKTAWICTTILPSLFVFIGFCVFALVGDRNMQPLTLNLKDYNSNVKENPINPILFNNQSTPFHCSPGACSHKQYRVQETITGEDYLFCGYVAKLLSVPGGGYSHHNVTCKNPGGLNIMSTIHEGGAVPILEAPRNVRQASEALLDRADTYAATQYGAIWFTNFPNSTMPDGSLYKDSAIQQCRSFASYVDYLEPEFCENYGGVGYVVEYNFTAIHVVPLFINIADEAIARYATNNPNIKMKTTIAPLPITLAEDNLGAAEDALTAWFLVVLSFPFIAGAYGSFIVSERESKAKHLQTVAGVVPSAYWLATFLWDTLNYQIPLWITVGLMFGFSVDVLTTSNRDVFTGILSLLVLFGPASAGFTYCVSYIFTSPSLCNMAIIISGFLVGMGGPLACYILRIFAIDPLEPKPHLADIADTLSWILRVFPTFCLGKGLFNVVNIDTFIYFEEDDTLTSWEEPILLYEVYFLAGECVFYPLLAILLDKWSTNPRIVSIARMLIPKYWFQGIKKEVIGQSLPDDDDVIEEQKLVAAGEAKSDLIVLDRLSKVYGNGKRAVDSLSLAIPPGQCFGLLGINGAGKTTTMGILTAEFPPSSGDAMLAGYSVSNEPQKTRRKIGYCPQFDAHFPNLTGREHVELYASIKGVPLKLIREVAAQKLGEVGLSDYDADRISSQYSGGMKRRLSLACATVGSPQIIMLDEPSTGVDPVSRREIWQLISDMVLGKDQPESERPSVILTTHSMEECEALCPRIGIMANGRLRCLGSAQHLKNKFGQGFQVELKTKLVSRHDGDYQVIIEVLQDFKASRASLSSEHSEDSYMEDIGSPHFFHLEECREVLEVLTNDSSLSKLIREGHPIGHVIWTSASSRAGVSMKELAGFAACELRMNNVAKFMDANFPKNVMRERQDAKARYEVDRDGIQISAIFAKIEDNKKGLLIADYSVSQTSLEQVFNYHAAEAERMKEGWLD